MAVIDSLLSSGNVSFGFTTIIVTTLLLLVLKVVRHFQKYSVLNKMPGPKTRFFFGNALEIMGGPTDFFDTVRNNFCSIPGGLSRVWIMHKPFVFIYGASGMEAVLNNSRNIDKGTDYTRLHSWIGLGLLTSTGSKWHTRRKMITPAFHFKILEEFVEIFNRHSKTFVNKIRPHSDGKVFDIFPFIVRATLDVILESAMGCTINAQEDPQSEYVKAVHNMGRIFIMRFARPWLQYEWVFNLTSLGRLQKKSLEVIHKFSMDRIVERKKEYLKAKSQKKEEKDEDEIIGKKKRQAFLDLLIEYSDQGYALSDLDIREEVDTFMFEGHDTTSAGITWTIYLLGQHPEIQEKVFEEIDSIFGKSDRPANTDDIRQMNYLECVIKESLRLLSPVPLFLRQLTEDMTIDGYKVPSGTDLGLFTYALHRDPKHFPDPYTFQPERFSSENISKRHPYAYVPFSAGPRNCIGQRFALWEEKVVLSTFIRNYRVESLIKMKELKMTLDMILRPDRVMEVKIFPRT